MLRLPEAGRILALYDQEGLVVVLGVLHVLGIHEYGPSVRYGYIGSRGEIGPGAHPVGDLEYRVPRCGFPEVIWHRLQQPWTPEAT